MPSSPGRNTEDSCNTKPSFTGVGLKQAAASELMKMTFKAAVADISNAILAPMIRVTQATDDRRSSEETGEYGGTMLLRLKLVIRCFGSAPFG